MKVSLLSISCSIEVRTQVVLLQELSRTIGGLNKTAVQLPSTVLAAVERGNALQRIAGKLC